MKSKQTKSIESVEPAYFTSSKTDSPALVSSTSQLTPSSDGSFNLKSSISQIFASEQISSSVHAECSFISTNNDGVTEKFPVSLDKGSSGSRITRNQIDFLHVKSLSRVLPNERRGWRMVGLYQEFYFFKVLHVYECHFYGREYDGVYTNSHWT